VVENPKIVQDVKMDTWNQRFSNDLDSEEKYHNWMHSDDQIPEVVKGECVKAFSDLIHMFCEKHVPMNSELGGSDQILSGVTFNQN
jgi:hypothetical protein